MVSQLKFKSSQVNDLLQFQYSTKKTIDKLLTVNKEKVGIDEALLKINQYLENKETPDTVLSPLLLSTINYNSNHIS